MMVEWKPTITRDLLALRSSVLMHARHFFVDRGVIEVDTPMIVNAPVTDVHIHSARVEFPDSSRRFFLHTSPEYAMKRLLAAGSGDIFQICHVARGLERGRQHNAEFTLIEWYRVGYDLDQLMHEVETLVRTLLAGVAFNLTSEQLSYEDAFLQELNLDPLEASLEQLSAAAAAAGFSHEAQKGADRDELLEFLMGTVIGPKLGHGSLTFVFNYPASQAALARVHPLDPRWALRFELYCKGMELANGFLELFDADEQRERFERDNEERQRRGMAAYPIDERLLAALESGLPECAGVAVGFDRVLMLAAQVDHIDAVLPFPTDIA
ncbi:MAG: EF-P lysine aminoacylase GenX [Proteobacteria bacterium]|nr:EF-P lysine aminoacylase GenX [Pseudomonadota bacterium]